MSLSPTQMEVYRYCERSDFISPATIESFKQKLMQENPKHIGTLSYALAKFMDAKCPKCNVAGAYKFHFMGNLKHNPGCGWSWYVSPGTYSATQLGKVFHAGISAGGEMMSEAEKKGERGGCLYAVFGFIFVSIFRLIFAVLMIPIQTVVSLAQRKPASGQIDKQ
jgi:hypothetical protein